MEASAGAVVTKPDEPRSLNVADIVTTDGEIAKGALAGPVVEQVTIAQSRSAAVREPVGVLAQWYDPPVQEGFSSVISWGKMANTGFLYVLQGVIEQFEPQRTAAGHDLEVVRVAILLFKRFAKVYTVKRELYMNKVRRTAAADLGVNVEKMLQECKTDSQTVALHHLLEELHDGDVDELTDHRSPDLYRRSVAIMHPVELALVQFFQRWVGDTFYVRYERFAEYIRSFATPSLRVYEPSWSEMEKRLALSPRPWRLDVYHAFIDANPSIWPMLAREMHAKVARRAPAVTMAPSSLSAITTAIAPNLTQRGGADDLLASGSQIAITATAANAYMQALMGMCMCNYRSRLVFASPDHTVSTGALIAMLALFAFPTWMFDEESLVVARNMIVRMLVRLTVWDDAEARAGMVDYSLRAVNPAVPVELEMWLHQTHNRLTEQMPPARAYYEGGKYNDMFVYPLGRIVNSPSEDMSIQATILNGIANFLNNQRTQSPMDRQSRQRLASGITVVRDALYRIPGIMLALQRKCVATSGVGCIAVPPGQYAYSGTDGYTANIPISGPLSLMLAEIEVVPPYVYDPTLPGFTDAQAIGSTMAALVDAYHIVGAIESVTRMFNSDVVRAVAAVFSQFGPSNWLSTMIINAMTEVPLKRNLVVPGEPGPWVEAINFCSGIVRKHPSLFGYAERVYVHPPAARNMGGATNVSYLWSPERLPIDVLTQSQLAEQLVTRPDELRELLHGQDGRQIEMVVKVKSAPFHRLTASVPDQHFERVLDVEDTELPLYAKKPIEYFITMADDVTPRTKPKGALERAPTISVDDPGMIRPNSDAANFVAGLVSHVVTRRENMRTLRAEEFVFVPLSVQTNVF